MILIVYVVYYIPGINTFSKYNILSMHRSIVVPQSIILVCTQAGSHWQLMCFLLLIMVLFNERFLVPSPLVFASETDGTRNRYQDG